MRPSTGMAWGVVLTYVTYLLIGSFDGKIASGLIVGCLISSVVHYLQENWW